MTAVASLSFHLSLRFGFLIPSLPNRHSHECPNSQHHHYLSSPPSTPQSSPAAPPPSFPSSPPSSASASPPSPPPSHPSHHKHTRAIPPTSQKISYMSSPVHDFSKTHKQPLHSICSHSIVLEYKGKKQYCCKGNREEHTEQRSPVLKYPNPTHVSPTFMDTVGARGHHLTSINPLPPRPIHRHNTHVNSGTSQR
ncbi:uncharacterized protein EI97DRAFT_233773 [Westerdykella ornata]|uniref:Uncharacterized protein n=1 Tax=Westerdykella ornata TaxID=318751 RepID=A0A6A6J6J9_WESOR|nr:uncharacterized protein EI97DRAFT_233773 [Westerdykella ornata]KAF2272200.1 hypothetical protein EI97DRAFT_233773 [Westerdykella ornata]